MEKLLTINELSLMIETTPSTITSWYRWKGLHPDHELAKMLPDFERGVRNVKLWKQDAINQLIAFKRALPQGRNGIMGDVTQKYVKKEK